MLRFRTFGAIDLRREDGERLDGLLGQPKRLALLAVLAAEQASGPVRRERVLPLLWPDSPPSNARHALSSTLSRLRRALGAAVLRGSGEETLWLSPDHFRADVTVFQQALSAGRPRDAAEVYRGPFLEGFRLGDGPAFEQWAEERRSSFRHRAYGACLEAARLVREDGEDLRHAERVLRKAVEMRPLKEEAVARLLRVLAERGERGEALDLYRGLRERLDDEHGLAPSEELRALADDVRAGRERGDGPRPGTPEAEEQREESDRGASDTSRSGVEPGHETGGDGTPDRMSRPALANPRPVVLAGALILALVLVAGGILVRDRVVDATGGSTPTPPAESGPPGLAVIPFENLDGGPEGVPFLRGLRAELVTRLSGLTGLEVVSKNAVDRYRAADLGLQALADSVGARWMLAGDAQRAGDTIRVNARLVDSATDRNVWAATFRRDRSGEHPFGLQRELTRRIVESLEVELTSGEERQIASPPTESATSYELYLQARGLTYPRTPTEEAADRAVALYRRALDLDSTFARAWSGLADVYAERIWRFGYPRAWADSGVAAAREAIRFDPDLPDAYAQLGDNLGTLGDTGGQIAAYREALRIRPGYVPVLGNLAAVHRGAGRLAESMRWLDRAPVPSADPPGTIRRLVIQNARLGRTDVVDRWIDYAEERGFELPWASFIVHLYYRHDVDRARRALRRIADRQQIEPAFQRASLALYEEDWETARREFRTVLERPRTNRGSFPLPAGAGLALALNRLGREDEAKSVARRSIDSATSLVKAWGAPEPSLRRGLARIVLGDTARALELLEEAVDQGFRDVRMTRTVPTLDPLRENPRFRALVSRMDSLLAVERRRVERADWGEPPTSEGRDADDR